ncbi:unnamed protein product [Rotaria sordida]|uniref:Cell division cycle protein 123 homolog n=1 Tax=Rotaria sordida TaxID=392033 RepID=A0A815S9I9_9BILA|nr:unnamed protein product [Rotaria sordida]CAF3873173.1 unnamed protein product [Rotaria sordida]
MDSNNTIEILREWYDGQLLKCCKTVYFNVEAWYKIIQSETFYTEFIPISPSIAQALVNFLKVRYTSEKLLNFNDIQLIVSIQNQLKEQIFNSKTNKFHSNGAFIRLSARSPNDGKRIDSQKINQFYEQKLNEFQFQYPNEYKSIKDKANMQIIASCARVYHDLIQALDCQKVIDNKTDNINNIELHNWNNNIIAREWNNLLDPSMKFRCFVYQSNLTAISQYNYCCKYYHLQNDTIIQKIKTTIIKYWHEKIQPLLDPWFEKYSNYVIDIGLIENKSTNKYDCIVIEMNPFETTTHSCLFDWTKDNNQLRGQGNEIEIRVQLDYYPNVEDYVESIPDINQCDEKNNSPSDHPSKEPYFIFLDKMKTHLSS